MTVTLSLGLTLLVGVFTLAAALAMVLVVLAQPRLRFDAGDYTLIAFYLTLALTSGLAFARYLSPEWYPELLLRLQLSTLALMAASFVWFISEILAFDSRARRLRLGGLVVILTGGVALAWTGPAFRVPAGDAPVVETAGQLSLGLLALGFAVSLWLVLNSHHRAASALRLPALLLVTGALLGLLFVFRPLVLDSVLVLAGAGLLGWRRVHTLIREPYTGLQVELRTANRDLQYALSEAASARQRIDELKGELQVVGQSQTEYLVRMGHELRTPLNTIIGFSELLHEGRYGDLNPLQDDRLWRIHTNGLRFLAILDDILDLNRIDSGMLRLEPVAFQLPLVVEPVIEQMGVRCAQKSLDLAVNLADDLPVLFGDETRIQQVIYNLLDNSIKFTDTGKITLSACYVKVSEGQSAQFQLPAIGWLRDGGWVVLAVTDTGVGIAPEDQGRIFDEFVQINLLQRRNHQGTGLGLTITRRLVEMHGGAIWVKSALGKGSTFYLALPADVRMHSPEAI